MKSDSTWRVRWRGVRGGTGWGSDTGRTALEDWELEVRTRARRSLAKLVRRGGEGGGDAGVYFQRTREGCGVGVVLPTFGPALEAGWGGGEGVNKGHVVRNFQSWAYIESQAYGNSEPSSTNLTFRTMLLCL